MFLYEVRLLLLEGGEPARLAEFVEIWGLVPREFLRGLGEPSATQQVAWLTPLTAMFIHCTGRSVGL